MIFLDFFEVYKKDTKNPSFEKYIQTFYDWFNSLVYIFFDLLRFYFK